MEVPDSWREAANRIAGDRGVTIVLGASDTGKTTFVGYCLRAIGASGETVAVVDADIGQSSVGPPTTVGVALFGSAVGCGDAPWPAAEISFVGAVSPLGHLLELAAGTARMTGKARELGAAAVLVDTTGLVHGGAAQALKHAKLSVIRPEHIAVLGGDETIERIIAPFASESAVYRLEAHPSCRRRSVEQRAANRQALFRSYFCGAQEMSMDPARLFLSGDGTAPQLGRLMGLAGAGDRTLALAVVTEACSDRIVVRTPLSAAERENVKGLQGSDFSPSF